MNSTSLSTNCSGSACRGDQNLMDGLGRVKHQNLMSDPSGEDSVDTSYDSNGRVYSISNPHRSGSSPTDGTEYYSYDGLDRKISVTEADGSVTHAYYGVSVSSNGGLSSQLCSGYGTGYPILHVDEVGSKRQNWIDGFGRNIEVDEPNSAGTLSAPTCYSYDLNNNLTGVLQSGSRQRTFTYDSLSRLTSAYNPESGNTCYAPYSGAACQYLTASGYDGNGNLVTKTDARGITTTYAYEALNRLTSKTYSDSTPGAYFTYDQTAPWGFTLTNPIGRLTTTGTTTGPSWLTESAFSYDAMGRLILEVPCIGTNCVSAYFTYDLAGDVNAVLYPSTRYVTTVYNSAIQPTLVTFASFNNTSVNRLHYF